MKGGGAPTGAPSTSRIFGCGRAPVFSFLPRLRGRVGRGHARLSALHRGSGRSANALTRSRPRFTRAGGCGRYPQRHSRLSEAPRAPVVMPAGTMPGPPGSGVTSPARRNRTRSMFKCVSRTRPSISEIWLCNLIGDKCQDQCYVIGNNCGARRAQQEERIWPANVPYAAVVVRPPLRLSRLSK